MGKQKYQEKVRELFEKSPVVSYNSIKRIIGNKKESYYVKQLIRNLILRKKIIKLTKGFYTSRDDPSLIVFCLKPAYLGLQDSLSLNNLWEQETIPIIIAARKVRQGIRNVNGSNVLIRRIEKKYLFGIDYIKQGDLYFPYSDLEKTLIDMVYFKEKLTEDAINSIKKKINQKKLKIYLKGYSNLIKNRVLRLLSDK